MKILSIDTASNICTVAILENKTRIKEITVDDTRNHSEKIMPAIEDVLSDTNLSLSDIDLIVCDKGPGSFTGIRIGVGTVLAFKDSLNIECIGISSLEALAYNCDNEGLICSLIDAKNDNVYWGLFEHKDNQYTLINTLEFNNINTVIKELASYSTPITFVGDGAEQHAELLKNSFTNYSFCSQNDLSSVSLGIAGYDTYKNGKVTSIMPLYLRKSQAERALEEKSKKE